MTRYFKISALFMSALVALSSWFLNAIIQDSCQTCLWLRVLWTSAPFLYVISLCYPHLEKLTPLFFVPILVLSWQKASFAFLFPKTIHVSSLALPPGAFCQAPMVLGVTLPTWSLFVGGICIVLTLISLLTSRKTK